MGRPFTYNTVGLTRLSTVGKCLNILLIIPQPINDVSNFCNSQFVYPANIDL
jgi:hypothetical protein